MKLHHLTAVWFLAIAACAIGIPDYLPPPPKPEPCNVHVTVDGEYKGCVSHEHFERMMRGQL